MQKKALVVIDIQNDITKNYKDIIDNINQNVQILFIPTNFKLSFKVSFSHSFS